MTPKLAEDQVARAMAICNKKINNYGKATHESNDQKPSLPPRSRVTELGPALPPL